MATLEGFTGLFSLTSKDERDVQSKRSADSIQTDRAETNEHPSEGTKRQRARTRRLGLRSIANNMRYTLGHGETRKDAFDYEAKYPEDAIYEETAPNARVFRTYHDESHIFDANMVEEPLDTIDVLLVFLTGLDCKAGLFSAVVTTFIVQTSQNLRISYSQMSALLLFELVSAQRAIARGVPVDQVATLVITPSTPFTPATIDTWVNVLWFIRLSLSLITVLGVVLVKRWHYQYISLPSGTPRGRTRIRQYRYTGFKKWQLPIIIGLLSVLMQVALAIFFH
ncbi:hypothetical protein DFS33DRAFT_1450817 [Desarmillaria ectypa]|nr:hypothetical protein DFS33DRAFT_1450817 [Desarmillaria ectypa]